jgi:hypothetical protein
MAKTGKNGGVFVSITRKHGARRCRAMFDLHVLILQWFYSFMIYQ